MKLIERRVQGIAGSLLISLPKQWTRQLDIEKGSVLKIQLTESGLLQIAPEFVRTKKDTESTIVFDAFFMKRFFKEYLDGKETIHVKITKKEDRSKIHIFLKKFMNAQVIEESSKRMVIKCFKIEELNIQECFKRMFFLAKNMFEEKDTQTLQEMDINISKFYYLLIMQIRRYLNEGKYIEENQIPLVRALDYRMAAEKIERIADILKNPALKRTPSVYKKIKDCFDTGISAFISQDFEKALKALKVQMEIGKIQSNVLLERISEYTKDVANLVR